MKTIYKSQAEVFKFETENVPKDVIERTFIFNFFKESPIDSLKKLINFKEIDFNNKKLWGDSREDKQLYELLIKLRNDNKILYTCELYLDID